MVKTNNKILTSFSVVVNSLVTTSVKWMLGDLAKPRGGSSLAPVTNSRIFSRVTTLRPLDTSLTYFTNFAYTAFSRDSALEPSSENSGFSRNRSLRTDNVAMAEGLRRYNNWGNYLPNTGTPNVSIPCFSSLMQGDNCSHFPTNMACKISSGM